MTRHATDASLQKSREDDLVEQHLRFLDGYRRLQGGASEEPLRALADNTAAFKLYQGVTQALCAVFSSLGRSEDEDRPDTFVAVRRCINLPSEDESTQLLHRQLDILRKTTMALHALVTGRGTDRREMPTIPVPKPAIPVRSDVRGIARTKRPPNETEDLPTPKFDGPYEEMQSFIRAIPSQYCMVRRHNVPRARPSTRRKSG
jgi:hypothetical protein